MKDGIRKKSATGTVNIHHQGQPRTLTIAQAQELLGKAFAEKQYPLAIQLAGQLVAQQSGNEDARLLLYRALAATEQFAQLDTECSNRLANQPRNLPALEYKAHALRQMGRDAEALPLLEKAVSLSTTNVRLINALGTAYKELGQFAKALDCFQRATKIKPGFGKGYWNRSDLVTDTQGEINSLEAQIRRLPETSPEAPYFYFSLYRAYEKIGDFDRAFTALIKGNAAKKALLGYQVDNDLTADNNLRDFFAAEYGNLRQRIQDSKASFCQFPAIFIVGMPRSGTSLVEQILASHSQVCGGGELPLLTKATETLLHRLRLREPFPQCLSSLRAEDFAQLGFIYQQLTAPHLDGRTTLTNKFLLNYKAIPLIRLALPKAKIIHLDRNPMDTCFGCYRQLFNSGLGFTYSLEDLAKTHRSYQKMMATWRELLADEFLTINYESLTDNLAVGVKQLLDYCKLPWEDSCLNFHTTERTVKTASGLQVRQPVFNQGIGRWKNYEKQLKPLHSLLAEPPQQ